MRRENRFSGFLCAAAFVALLTLMSSAHGQVQGFADVNMSKMANYQNECAVAKNPTNKLQLFASCNNATGGLFAARSTDGGLSWTYPDAADKTIADGDANQGPLACCDPALAWDTFGNLFITYLGNANTVETILSQDGGATFTNLVTFGPASVDQPSVAVGAGSVWIVWNQAGQMRASGAAVTGLGTVGAFNAPQVIPGTANCSFGDVVVAPGGAVVQACETLLSATGETQETIMVNIDADGLGPNNFGAAIAATTTNVGGFDSIPAQSSRTVDAEPGLAFDNNPMSGHFARLYLVYTEEPTDENNDTNIMVRFSDNNGGNWSAPIRVDDDMTNRSQFLPRIATNLLSGNIGVCWHDARNSPGNNTMEEFCTIATPSGASPAFMANAQIGDALSAGTGSNPPVAGQFDIQFGDYSGMAYFQGLVHPAWADTSNSTADNPDGTTRYDAYTDRVWGGPAAMEGDQHITTVSGVHYDFQGGGEYVSLRDADGTEVQTRQTPVATSFNPGANPYTGLATCVSLNTAVAAQVGTHRVTYQPNLSGVPDPSGLQLRIDGSLTTLGASGIDLGSGGRITRTTAAGGIQIEFPNETVLSVVPGWWPSESKWYLNVDVLRTPSLEGLMGATMRGSWLPALPDGTSMGPKPASLHQRYVDLYQKFGEAWRVSDKTSLFDYAPGTSTATFTLKSWPMETPPCVIPETKPVEPTTLQVAEQACLGVTDKNMHADCVFDVRVTGNTRFAETYLQSQRIKLGATTTTVADDEDPTQVGETAAFTAIVTRGPFSGKGVPIGSVQFSV